jgi:hypothetical protein
VGFRTGRFHALRFRELRTDNSTRQACCSMSLPRSRLSITIRHAGTQSLLWYYHSHVCGTRRTAYQPHFHAYYQDDVAIYGVDPVDLIAGSLLRRQQRLVIAWAELHQAELLTDWERLQAGQSSLPIEPLK